MEVVENGSKNGGEMFGVVQNGQERQLNHFCYENCSDCLKSTPFVLKSSATNEEPVVQFREFRKMLLQKLLHRLKKSNNDQSLLAKKKSFQFCQR